MTLLRYSFEAISKFSVIKGCDEKGGNVFDTSSVGCNPGRVKKLQIPFFNLKNNNYLQ
jgi:hypothetical protein